MQNLKQKQCIDCNIEKSTFEFFQRTGKICKVCLVKYRTPSISVTLPIVDRKPVRNLPSLPSPTILNNTHDKLVWIYFLLDPRNDEVRYIGKTKNPSVRAVAHNTIHTNPRAMSQAKREWLQELKDLGLKPKLLLLEECPSHISSKVEKIYIANGLNMGWNLLNITDRPDTIRIANRFVVRTKIR